MECENGTLYELLATNQLECHFQEVSNRHEIVSTKKDNYFAELAREKELVEQMLGQDVTEKEEPQ